MSNNKLSTSPKLPKPQARADSTRRKILQAAQFLFLREGFAAVSIQRIAQRAGINHSLIFHHFNNKLGLWVAVKQRIIERHLKKKIILPSTDLSWNDFLYHLVKNSYLFYKENSAIAKLINWQRVEKKKTINSSMAVTNSCNDWVQAFVHYQQQGDINANLPVKYMITMLCSVTSSLALDIQPLLVKSDELPYLDACCLMLRRSFAA